MFKKTTFEQVPLEQVEKAIEREAKKEKAREPTDEMREKQPEPALRPKTKGNERVKT